jgi:hypothetical protein
VQTNDKTLARVGTDYLYLSDIQHQIPTELKKQDSIAFVESFIQKWVHDKLMFEKASDNLSEDQVDIEEKVEAFKQSLYVFKYEQKYISQKLDKKISAEEMQSFYNEHKSEFILSENIVKAYFIVFNKKVNDPSKLSKLLNSRKDDDLEKFKGFCYQYSQKFNFPDKWMSASSIANDLPNKAIDLNGIVRSKQTIFQQDSLNYYMFKVDQYLQAGDLAPIEYVQNDIKQVILQKRTQELNKTLRNKIFDDALKKNVFEIYNK